MRISLDRDEKAVFSVKEYSKLEAKKLIGKSLGDYTKNEELAQHGIYGETVKKICSPDTNKLTIGQIQIESPTKHEPTLNFKVQPINFVDFILTFKIDSIICRKFNVSEINFIKNIKLINSYIELNELVENYLLEHKATIEKRADALYLCENGNEIEFAGADSLILNINTAVKQFGNTVDDNV